MTTHITSHSSLPPVDATSTNTIRLHSMGAMMFGLALVLVVGFLPTAAAHNAAHDTRHALAFPCH